MAKVFGNETTQIAPARPEHFAYSSLIGSKTLCGITRNGRRRQILPTWKDMKMVTCQKCRKAGQS